MGSKQKNNPTISIQSFFLVVPDPLCRAAGREGGVCLFSSVCCSHCETQTQLPALDLGSDEQFPAPFPHPWQCCSLQQLAGVGKLYSNNQDIPISPPGEGVYVPGIFNLFAIWPIYEVIVQVTLSLSRYILVYKTLGLVL